MVRFKTLHHVFNCFKHTFTIAALCFCLATKSWAVMNYAQLYIYIPETGEAWTVTSSYNSTFTNDILTKLQQRGYPLQSFDSHIHLAIEGDMGKVSPQGISQSEAGQAPWDTRGYPASKNILTAIHEGGV